jgi:hypothetical protein
MPLFFAPFAACVLGFGLALLGRAELGRHDGALRETQTFRIAVYYALCVFVPVLGYLLTFHGDWFFLYVIPHSKVPSALSLLAILASAALIPTMVLAARTPLGTRLPLISSAALTLLVLVCWRRLGAAASYLQFHGQFGLKSSGAAPLGLSIVLCAIALGSGLGLAHRELTRDG